MSLQQRSRQSQINCLPPLADYERYDEHPYVDDTNAYNIERACQIAEKQVQYKWAVIKNPRNFKI